MVAERPNGGIFFAPDLTVLGLLEQIVPIIARYRIPSIFSERAVVEIGGLVYYGTIGSTSTGAVHLTSTASSAAKSLAICRFSSQRSTNWSSTSRPPRPSASQYLRQCLPAPTW